VIRKNNGPAHRGMSRRQGFAERGDMPEEKSREKI